MNIPQKLEAGVDEAGRGCLAGPVFAAAVILPEGYAHSTIIDSKKMSHHRRLEARTIIEKEALSWKVGISSEQEIDTLNILQASVVAMHRSIISLSIRPKKILVDGNYFKPVDNIPYACEIKGDDRFVSIAAASILAKTYRDEWMMELHKKQPQYNWKQNKGYPTREHRRAIKTEGISPYHRKSFNLLPKQIELSF